MNRITFFNSGLNRLSCVITLPDRQSIKASVIFVHAANSNRLGPHRMFVEAADRLKHAGIASFRFDMRGCGDSEGYPAENDINPDIEDLRNAIEFLTSTYRTPKIFLFGISRGAQVCLLTLAVNRLPVDGAVLLSTPFSSTKTAVKTFSSRLKEYLYKFKDRETLKKFLSGKANLKQILKTLIFALNSRGRYHQNSNGFSTRCPLFFIYGSEDPITADSAIHYSRICERYKISHETAEIKNANHSFFHYLWKEQIIIMSEKWMQKQIGNGEINDNLS
jgi:pimeloyl-ACP methyl ester carboxylesterase